MTVLFSDLQDFTLLCESQPPDQVVAFLNAHFDRVSSPIRAEDGIIDKYIGDSVMAFWGPPFTNADIHPLAACRAAVAQQLALSRHNAAHAAGAASQPTFPVHMRIGICTGEVIAGNVGSIQTKSYTVIGDAVNLAARLQSAAKRYGTGILISEDTWQAAHHDLETREIDKIRVLGRREPVRIFEVCGLRDDPFVPTREMRETFQSALRRLQAGEMGAAKFLFERCLSMRPTDGPSALFLTRIAEIEQSGLPRDWDGAWSLNSK